MPKGYNGTAVTTHKFSDVLPFVISRISKVHEDRPDLVLAAWPHVIGPKMAQFTQPISFVNGILTVKVKNSTIHSLLTQNDKPKILNALRQKFPDVRISNVYFRLG